jgi:hypothetical protein
MICRVKGIEVVRRQLEQAKSVIGGERRNANVHILNCLAGILGRDIQLAQGSPGWRSR